MSGSVDLIGLIDLSLGDKPAGVVNFNYLHSLLHEIVRRLGIYEEQQMSIVGSGPPPGYMSTGRGYYRGSMSSGTTVGPSDVSLLHPSTGITGGIDSADGTPTHTGGPLAAGGHHHPPTYQSTTSISSSGPTPQHTVSIPGTSQPTGVSQPVIGDGSMQPGVGVTGTQGMGVAGGTQGVAGQQGVAGAQGGVASTTGASATGTGVAGTQGAGTTGIGVAGTQGGAQNVGMTGSQGVGVAGTQGVGVGGVSVSGTQGVGMTGTQGVGIAGAGVSGTQGVGVAGAGVSGTQGVGVSGRGDDRSSSSDISRSSHHSSHVDITHRPSSKLNRHRSSVVSAANDVSYLERKLTELELRVNTMESLPEMMEKKGSDVNATPIRDMWNITNLNGKVKGVEDGIDKTSQLVDDLLGEVHGLKQQLSDVQGSVEKRLDHMDSKLAISASESSKLEDELKQLKALKAAASSDSPSDAFMGIVNDIQGKVDGLQIESQSSKERLTELEGKITDSVSSADFTTFQESMKDQSEDTNTKLALLQGKIEASDYTVDSNMKTLTASIEDLSGQMKNIENAIADKVSASDLSSLIPSGGGSDEGAAAILPEILKLQNKVKQLEDQVNKQPTVPSDLMDKVNSMQNAIDHLSTEVSKLSSLASSGVDSGRVDELGSQIAQFRDRMEETDRAIQALTTALSEQGVAVRDDKTGEYVEMELFKGLQEFVQNLQESQERLLGTTANISHELEVNQEHVKALYSALDDLKANKVDKDQLALEVEEKADRSALEGKANREWVDSTFERLDREIREAKSHLLGQEEAFRNAVGQINEDVEGKLDRLELEPFKDYIDKKLRSKTAPIHIERVEPPLGDDAAGFRKPLRFKCISCDKPLGLKSADPMPTLPMNDTLPPTRSFRPYTTYELELIRRHQRIQPTSVMGHPPPSFPVSIRSAGGSHTLTRPHQKIRVAPYSAVYPDNVPNKSTPPVFVHDEMEIVGHDGHVYKGRRVKQTLPPVGMRKYPKTRATKVVRPSSTTPLQSVPS